MNCENDERIDEDEAYFKKNKQTNKEKELKEDECFFGITQTQYIQKLWV